VLSASDIGVALDFSRFRERLTSETIGKEDPQMQTLLSSAPFFLTTTLRVLLAAVKAERGAKLEHSLRNFNLLLIEVWGRITEEDKWAVGTTYAEVANDGKSDVMAALRRSLIRVSGFDYVPESLRSNTFKLAAQTVIEAHFSMDNFHLEAEPVKTLSRLGTIIPRPALIDCMRAYLCVYLGNRYGFSFAAAPLAYGELTRISADRWEYYLGKVLPNDDTILLKLMDEKPIERFCALMLRIPVTPSLESGMSPIAIRLINAARQRRLNEVNKLATTRWTQRHEPATS
jgi:hypothetical protein